MFRYWLFTLRLAALIAISFSCALLLHYLSPSDGAFCGGGSGCEVVRKSEVATFGPKGLLPGLGMIGYVAVFWLSFLPTLRRLVVPAALFGAALSLLLLVYQAVALGAFCWLCVSVEVSSLLVAVSAVMLERGAHRESQWDAVRGWAWFVLLALSLNAATIWTKVRSTESLPDAIADLQQPDVVTVVEFTDFECPHCRRMHQSLTTALEVFPKAHRLVRHHAPLNLHTHADAAARAAICAANVERGDAMADRLFTGGLEQSDLYTYAASLGIPEADFRACLEAPTTRETLTRDRNFFHEVGGKGVPLTFIGAERVDGAVGANVVAQMLDRASKPRGFTGLSPLAFGALMFVAVGVVLAVGRFKSAS